jgi:Cu-Zn family superoxide dismutase
MMNIKENPVAYAAIKGNKFHPDIKGKVDFYDAYGGTVLLVVIQGLPKESGGGSLGFHGFHIHAGGVCMENSQGEFISAGSHYNPENTLHPSHAGDLPPLLGNDGTAWMAVYTNRFYPEDIVGHTVVIHEKADDFRTQPSGDAGDMIACGEITEWDMDNFH